MSYGAAICLGTSGDSSRPRSSSARWENETGKSRHLPAEKATLRRIEERRTAFCPAHVEIWRNIRNTTTTGTPDGITDWIGASRGQLAGTSGFWAKIARNRGGRRRTGRSGPWSDLAMKRVPGARHHLPAGSQRRSDPAKTEVGGGADGSTLDFRRSTSPQSLSGSARSRSGSA